MGDFFASLFGGSNKTLNKDINQSGATAGYDTNVGEGLTTAGANFQRQILSGDPTQQAAAVAPETKAAQDQLQQSKNQTAQFGNRSGGSTATTANGGADLRAKILAMLGGLKSGTAATAVGEGTNLTGQGLQATGQEAGLSQERMQNWLNSILGQGISSGIGSAEGFGLGAGENALNPTVFKALAAGG